MLVPKIIRAVGLGTSLVVMMACMSGGPKGDPKNVAEEMAQQWVNGHVDEVSEKLAQSVSKEHTKIAKWAFARILKNSGELRYVSSRISQDSEKWKVTVLLKKSIDLSLIRVEKVATVDAAFDIWIDTKSMIVENKKFSPAGTTFKLAHK